MARFFEGENFHEFYESIAIRENFTLKIFTKSIRHCVLLTRFMKIFPLKVGLGQFVKIFLLEKNPLYGSYHK